ncbi:MAG: fibronectin type III domain-containing protein [Bacteroides sp.]|nr:fibronectin type III domain-containing protein [Bacteroides sp.]
MKRLSTILAGILLVLGVSYAETGTDATPLQTGARLNTYNVTKTDGTYRSLTDNATVLFTTDTDSLINHLYFKKDGGADAVSVGKTVNYSVVYTPKPEAKDVTITLDQVIMFGAVKAKGIGVTSDGFLFFAAENEKVTPSFYAGNDNVTYSLLSGSGGKTKNLLYFLLADTMSGNKYKSETSLYADNTTKIGYETQDGVLYIGYENIIIKESASEKQIVSWNYQINLQTGSIALQTKGFYADADKNYPSRKFAFGLLGATQGNDHYWLTGFNPATASGAGEAMQQCLLAKDSLTEGTLYAFNPPSPCATVTGATVEVKKAVTANSINLNGTTWTGSDNALVILSETEELKSAPENGKEYSAGTGSVKVGNNKAAYLVAKNEKGAVTGLSAFLGLKAATDYWVHVFVYNRACSDGPLYGSAVKVEKISTAMSKPAIGKDAVSDVSTASLKLTLPASTNKYVVGVSEEASVLPVSNVLENGRTYTVGEKIGGNTLKLVDVGEGVYTIDGLKSGSIAYINVWSVKGSGSDIEYSADYTSLAALTIYEIPLDIDFSNAIQGEPVGWALASNENSSWMLSQYGSSGVGPLGGRVPADGSFYLFGQLMPTFGFDEDDNMIITGNYSTYAVSPVMTKGNEDKKLAMEFKIGMGSANFMSGYQPTALKDGDSMVISYARNQDSETWKPVAKVGKEFNMQEGFGSLSVSDFAPEFDTFCFRFEYYITVPEGTTDMVMGGCVIEGFIVEEDMPCKYPQNITVAQEDITTTSAIVRWEDGNADFAEKFIVKYRPASEEESAEISREIDEDSIVLTDLRHTTPYTVSVQAVCKGDKGNSLVKTATFTTEYALVLPYLYEANAENTKGLPESSKNMRGLPGADLKEISPEEDYPAAGWEWTQDATQGKDMTVAVNLDVNANNWLILPSMTAEHTGTVGLQINATAYSLNDFYQGEEAAKTNDTLWVFVSSSADFTTREVVAAMPIDSFHFKMEALGEWQDTMYYTEVNGMEFAVEQGKVYHVAFFVPGKGAVAPGEWEGTSKTVLAIGSIAMDYSSIEYPAVTDLDIDNLSQTGLRLNWKGEADTYRILWKEVAATAYDTVKDISEQSYTFTGLKPSTEYAFRVYGLYDGVAGLVSQEITRKTLDEETKMDTVAMPVFNPAGGDITKGSVIKITCDTADAEIYYTVDGSEPTKESIRYTFGISVDTSMTLKAIAYKGNLVPSRVAEARYNVVVANEGAELAGVRLYPNPTTGNFSVYVPVAAKVEVFASNGIVVKNLTMTAGTREMRLDNSGIYFVRFTAEDGRVAVQRVVVR